MPRKKAESKTETAGFFAEALAAAEKRVGKHNCYIAAKHNKYVNVIPIKHLSLQWLINSNGWPLQRYTQSGGDFGTQKSSFMFQLIKWYLDAGGFCFHVDTENKTSPSLMRSIITPKYFDEDNPRSSNFQYTKARSINEWQKMLTDQLKLIEKHFPNGEIPFPVLWTVDSLMGVPSEEALETVDSDGQAQGRGYSDAPILISNYLKALTSKMLGWNVTLHAVHHEKPSLQGRGQSRSGGKAPDFYATIDLRFLRGGVTAYTKSPVTDIKTAKMEGRNIKIKIRKSSMGPDNREIVVPFLWKFIKNEDTDTIEQVSWWDWESTTAMVLLNNARDIKSDFNIESKRKHGVGVVCWCKELEIAESDALPASEFGNYIETNEQLMTKFQELLHIEKHTCPDYDNSE